MSSFVGANVRIARRNGEPIVAKILGVDPATATLTLERLDTGAQCEMQRSELADVSMATDADVAAATSERARVVAPVPAQPVQKPARGTLPASVLQSVPPSASPASDSRAKKRSARRSKGSDASGSSTPQGAQSGGDFDFSKGLQSFDKKKVWDEIRVCRCGASPAHSQSQQDTDPATLLVNTNRRSNASKPAPRQPMLAPNEMVLTEPERDAAPAALSGSADQQVQELQKALESARAERDALAAKEAQHRAQSALLEALLGVQIAPAQDADTYVCTALGDARVNGERWREKHSGAPAPADARTGALQYRVRAAGLDGEPALTYLGPVTDATDAAILERLPEHFRGEINFKLDNAMLFQRRLMDVARA